MTARGTGNLLRKALLAALVVALAAVVFGPRLADDGPSADDARAQLESRVGRYMELRLAADWPALYELTDPQQRQRVDLVRFLDAYGHGAMRVVDIRAQAVRFDPARMVGAADLLTRAELVVERLPATYRRGLQEEHPEHLVQTMEHSVTWVWRDGQWYYLMDREIVAGVDPEGNPIQPVGRTEG